MGKVQAGHVELAEMTKTLQDMESLARDAALRSDCRPPPEPEQRSRHPNLETHGVASRTRTRTPALDTPCAGGAALHLNCHRNHNPHLQPLSRAPSLPSQAPARAPLSHRSPPALAAWLRTRRLARTRRCSSSTAPTSTR
eukprot:7390000-Prymnesium_polylepis.1